MKTYGRRDTLVNIDIAEGIALLKMENGTHNRFNSDFIDEFQGVLDRFESGENARAIVITNNGKYFTEGMDIEWVMNLSSEVMTEFFINLFRFFHRVFTYPLPVVAGINGHAIASGLAFAMCSDVRVMRSEKAVCSFPEVDLHIEPPPGCIEMVAHAIGRYKTEKAFLTGRPYRGEAALAMGFADELVDSNKVLDRTIEIAKELASKPLSTYSAIKMISRGEIASSMLKANEKYIRGSQLVSMFQGCDLDCLRSLS